MKIRYILLILLTLVLYNCDKVENFDDIGDPRYFGEYSNKFRSPDTSSFTVVSFNIEYAIEIDKAIEELSLDENLSKADVILLQEMDEVGTEKIAKALEYNYVYYPASRYPNGNLFGLAILSKYQIVEDEKILLPHATPVNNRKRIAITSKIAVGDQFVRVYNIHPATLSVPKAHRREQFETIVNHLGELNEVEDQDLVVVGGDFNTDKQIDIDYLVNLYEESQLTWVSEEIGPTWHKFSGFAKYTLDHLFAKGFTLIDAGKASESRASDHLPIWVKLDLME